MIMVARLFDIFLYCLFVEIDYIGRYSSIKGMHDYCDAQNLGGFFFFFYHCPSLSRQRNLCLYIIPLSRARPCSVRAQALSWSCPERCRRVPKLVMPNLSRPDSTMSQRDLHVKTQTQWRPRISDRNLGISSHDQALSRHEISCRNTKPLHLATLCHDIKYSIAIRKLMA